MATDDRPSIIVNRCASLPESSITELLLGIEEEGIPYTVRELASSDVAYLAHEAAVDSRLGVGVGAAHTGVAVTTEKLPEERPYITEQLNLRASLDRAIGANAARLVKRIPLRDMRGDS